MESKGTLYLVATPIGNLEDITLRALRVLKEADLIAAEDTRQTLKLLNHFEIKKPLVSYYEHNKDEKGKYLIQKLSLGENIALVSDAGTPGISDPGEDLVRQAVAEGITVTMVPGPVAAIMGVVLSGLPAGRFVFEGFLPVNKRSRKEHFAELVKETRTMILYEAPHKLIHTLADLLEILGDRRISIARELTKKFEEITRCSLSEAVELYRDKTPKGEFVLIIEGLGEKIAGLDDKTGWNGMSVREHFENYLSQGFDKKESIKRVAHDRGLNKREVYAEVMYKEK